MSKKMIITFEGIEGSGKSLHIGNVARHLKKKKISFVRLREPGGSKNSEKIRKLILNNKSNFNKYTDLFLYLNLQLDICFFLFWLDERILFVLFYKIYV